MPKQHPLYVIVKKSLPKHRFSINHVSFWTNKKCIVHIIFLYSKVIRGTNEHDVRVDDAARRREYLFFVVQSQRLGVYAYMCVECVSSVHAEARFNEEIRLESSDALKTSVISMGIS